MPGDQADALARLLAQGDAVVRETQSAARVHSDHGRDKTESVTASLDTMGRVAAIDVAMAWRRRVGIVKLSAAVLEAVQDASTRRLRAWGEAFGGAPLADKSSVEDFHQRLRAVTSSRHMSEADREVALAELLALAQGIERGIDDVSERLNATLSASHTGRSPDGHVTVVMTGGGDLSAVRLDRPWLRDAHEINISRQTTAAFRAAYKAVAEKGPQSLIEDSPLGEVRRATQDPLGLARRLRLTD
jgi:DNA-binding protein YbaB